MCHSETMLWPWISLEVCSHWSYWMQLSPYQELTPLGKLVSALNVLFPVQKVNNRETEQFPQPWESMDMDLQICYHSHLRRSLVMSKEELESVRRRWSHPYYYPWCPVEAPHVWTKADLSGSVLSRSWARWPPEVPFNPNLSLSL